MKTQKSGGGIGKRGQNEEDGKKKGRRKSKRQRDRKKAENEERYKRQ